ncbi:MAG: FAD binding domain-containing protein [Burkholderiales bacterium]|nr:FAD binding domain-containing protein [Burkholderiales bacterium]
MKPFDYAAPVNLDHSLRALARGRGTRALAGGTDLLALMKARVASPDVLLNVKQLRDLSRDIALDERGASLGALVTLADIELDPAIAQAFPALAQAAASAATPQLRNMATLGGTLLQRPRCWYFRSERFECWLKGGTECHARHGENQFHAVFDTGCCRAVHPSDVACALSALKAEIELRGSHGPRRLAIGEFFDPPREGRRVETVLRDDELVVAVHVPRPAPGSRSIYLKAMDRAAWAFALVSVAACLRMDEDRVAELELVLGGVATVPWPVGEALRHLVGKPLAARAIAEAARGALAGAEPLRMNAYKLPLAQALIRRALHSLAGSASEAVSLAPELHRGPP